MKALWHMTIEYYYLQYTTIYRYDIVVKPSGTFGFLWLLDNAVFHSVMPNQKEVR